MSVASLLTLLLAFAAGANAQLTGTVCQFTAWANSGVCTNGVQLQTRTKTFPPGKAGGAECVPLTRSLPCTDCAVSEWDLTAPCAGGSQTQARTVTVQPVGTGAACPPLLRQVACRDCSLSDWDTTATCVNNVQTQTRTVLQEATNGGTCGSLTRELACNNCEVSAWNTDGACTNGWQTQTRTVTVAQTNGGTCNVPFTQTVACTDCVMSDWVTGPCVKTAGSIVGTQLWSRTIEVAPTNGGMACGALSQVVACNDCVVGEWSTSGQCVAKGGALKQTQTRVVVTDATNGGAACPALERDVDCTNCIVGDWDTDGVCAPDAENAAAYFQTQTRPVITQPTNGGTACEALSQRVPCSNCVVSDWSVDAPCVNGKQHQVRTVTTPANLGTPCPTPLERDVDCTACVVSAWDGSADCVGGSKVLTRTVLKPATNGGAACPALTQTVDCNDCQMTAWTKQGTCGFQQRVRSVSLAPVYGKACDALVDYVTCDIDCVTEVVSTTECSSSSLTYTITRRILVAPMGTGKACPALTETMPCSIFKLINLPFTSLTGNGQICAADGTSNVCTNGAFSLSPNTARTLSFTDTRPVNSAAYTGLRIKAYGTRCGGGCQLSFSINGVAYTTTSGTVSALCSCSDCTAAVYSATFPTGVQGYRFGATNTISFTQTYAPCGNMYVNYFELMWT